ncbi:ABC transporter ATP-binding protein [Domibacillus antri]|uniref:ABC transporter ATP-binding protein n=1 Tax=Domibacillus antri TaxID=1714264 RepID=A0A1Q8Q451_9BACI|nr:ABC transporter ATP-binding protein [Domibacillus antri]OLN22120.1 ABC transporter ATP-binding protein [Domibacillus antri]
MKSEPILQVDGVAKSFGGLNILKNLTFDVRKGERIGIIGPNGAGKTTFYNLLAGDLDPSKGTIHYCGKNITSMPNYKRARTGIVRTFQKNNLLTELTVLENLLLVLQRKEGMGHIWFKRRHRKKYPSLFQKADELLHTWGLEQQTNKVVKSLSYGEQRQIEILLGIATEPNVLLLDEPTAGMSQAETDYIVDLLRKLPKSLTLMIIEHDLDVVFGLADRMIVLYNGEILVEGDPHLVRNDKRVNDIYIGQEADLSASS